MGSGGVRTRRRRRNVSRIAERGGVNEAATWTNEIAAAEDIDRGYVGSILQLTLLAPDIVQAILDGRQPAELGLPTLLKPFAVEWVCQRAEIGV